MLSISLWCLFPSSPTSKTSWTWQGVTTPDVMAVSAGVGEARCSVASYIPSAPTKHCRHRHILTFIGPGVVVVTRPRRRWRRRRLLAPNIAASSSTNFGGVETPQLSPNLAVGRNGRRNSGAVVG